MLDKLLSSFALYGRARVIAILFLGFASGLPLPLASSTFSIWLTDVGIKSSTIGLLSMVAIPYSLKFLWAPFFDRFSIPFLSQKLGQRRSWMVVIQACLMASIILLGQCDPTENMIAVVIAATIMTFCSASQDIIIDAFRIESLPHEEQGAGAAFSVGGYRLGMLFSNGILLYMAEYFDWSTIYICAATGILVGLISALTLSQDNTSTQKTIPRHQKTQTLSKYFKDMVIMPFADFLQKNSRNTWITIILFIITFKLGDTIAGVMTNTFLLQIGFNKAEIATIVKIFGFAATMVGLLVGGGIVYRYNIYHCLWIGGLLQMTSNLFLILQAEVGYNVPLLIFTIAIENFTGAIGTSIFVAYLSSLCNMPYTATQYALLSALSSIGRTFMAAPAGFIADKLGWSNFFLISTFAAIPGLALLSLIKPSTEESKTS